jgi:hypothetical protein
MSQSQGRSRSEISSAVLQDRLRYLAAEHEANIQRIAEAFTRERQELYNETSNPKNVRSIIKGAIRNPSRSTLRTLICLVNAMGGQIYIEWGDVRDDDD